MQANNSGLFIDAERLDMKKYAQRPSIAKALCDFLLYHDHNPRKALELCAEATVQADFKDWWWKARLGKCYYQLGLYRDAEKQFKSSIKEQSMVAVVLELCKVYIKIDQPNNALAVYKEALEGDHPDDHSLLIGIARVHDMLGDTVASTEQYKKVLATDPSNVEAIASLAANHFYTDQPEIALRFFRRLLQMGVQNTELWNNIGLSCFLASQYDMTLSCFERALALADNDNMADVWYNIGWVAIGIGDLGLAYQAFKIAISCDGNHAESYDNLGVCKSYDNRPLLLFSPSTSLCCYLILRSPTQVLELRKGNIDHARSNFQTAQTLAPYLFEPFFNGGERSMSIPMLLNSSLFDLVCNYPSITSIQIRRFPRSVRAG
jgi:tetratricopeptide repeat protein 8